MAPELLVPSKFGLDRCAPSKEGDIYAMAMVIYQVCTTRCPNMRTHANSSCIGTHWNTTVRQTPSSEVVFKVLGGGKPSRPANALELGLSDKVWKLLEECWRAERVSAIGKDVLGRVKAAASVCGTLPPVGGVPQRYEDPDSDFNKFGRSLPLVK
jgi:hypothetical protein